MDLRLEPLTHDPRRHVAASVSDAPRAEELELSIVMPCLNEAETVGACVATALDFLQRHSIAGEVIVADNGSTDASRAIAAREGARIVDAPLRGYGAALQTGIAAARGRYVIIGDSDSSYDLRNSRRSLRRCVAARSSSWATASRAGFMQARCRASIAISATRC